MGTLETLAAKLAEDTVKAMQETGNDRLYVEVGDVLGASSQSLEEAFLTEMRVRLSEATARRFLMAKVAEARGGPKATAPTEE